jgi:hypothetical protein
MGVDYSMDVAGLLATGTISLWILLLGLFFPRLTLFLAWLTPGAYPANTLPDLVNFVCWLMFPRFLMAFYVYVNIGTANIWFWTYIVLGIVGLFGESGYVRHRITRRTTVSRDGRTVTTVEEEDV